jgi:hypothetical protein
MADFDAWKPSIQLHAVLSGATSWSDASPSIQSWAQLEIHRGAVDILSLPTIEKRRAILQKIPGDIRVLVEAEIMRLWKMRNHT